MRPQLAVVESSDPPPVSPALQRQLDEWSRENRLRIVRTTPTLPYAKYGELYAGSREQAYAIAGHFFAATAALAIALFLPFAYLVPLRARASDEEG